MNSDIIEKGFQQRISDLEDIANRALKALIVVASSHDSQHARSALMDLGIDLAVPATSLSQAMHKLGWPLEVIE